MQRGHVIVKRGGGRSGRNALSLHIPSELARIAGVEAGMVFAAEVTDDGILYRPVDVPPMHDPRPSWRRED